MADYNNPGDAPSTEDEPIPLMQRILDNPDEGNKRSNDGYFDGARILNTHEGEAAGFNLALAGDGVFALALRPAREVAARGVGRQDAVHEHRVGGDSDGPRNPGLRHPGACGGLRRRPRRHGWSGWNLRVPGRRRGARGRLRRALAGAARRPARHPNRGDQARKRRRRRVGEHREVEWFRVFPTRRRVEQDRALLNGIR